MPSLQELSHALKDREISSVELTKQYLGRIEKAKALNAFVTVDEEGALLQAKAADKVLKTGKGHVLTGIPMAHKDIFCTQSMPTTCGSKMLANYYSPFDATLVKRLAESGTVLLGKTNMDEFAMGSTSENSYFGPVKNPWHTGHVPGGSSGGSAAAVAAELVPFATGSDTGGSIRQPAAFCGISGLKPTYGLVSRFGMVAYASSLDQAGPMAQTAEDIALILQAMAGFDVNDSTSASHACPDYITALRQPAKPLTIGLPSCFFHPEVDGDIQKAIRTAVALLEQMGATVVELDLTLHAEWVACYYVIACAEASSNLSRFDGVRFGHRTKDAPSLRELITRSRSEGFGTEVKRRILTGTHVLSSGYYDAYYLQAQKVRRMIRDEILKALSTVDVIIGPTTPTCAFTLGQNQTNPIKQYLSDVFTVAANLAGLPALSIPAGMSHGLPIGMQILGPHFSEPLLLKLGYEYQQATLWHQMKPSLNREFQ